MSDLEKLVNGLVLHSRLSDAALDSDLEWIVPPGFLEGVTRAYGLPVRRVTGIEAPYLAHRIAVSGSQEGTSEC